MFYIKINIWST